MFTVTNVKMQMSHRNDVFNDLNLEYSVFISFEGIWSLSKPLDRLQITQPQPASIVIVLSAQHKHVQPLIWSRSQETCNWL